MSLCLFTVEAAVPGTHVVVSVEFSVAGEVLRSSAVFVAAARGGIDPASVAPLEGSYSGVDGRGLYWSADPEAAWPSRPSIDDVPVRAVARVDGVVVDTVQLVRAMVGDGVEIVDVNDSRTPRFFKPSGPDPSRVSWWSADPKVGGRAPMCSLLRWRHTAWHRSQAVAYFGMDGLPAFHREVPIQDVHRAIGWLGAHVDVRPGGVGVFGSLRGAGSWRSCWAPPRPR